MTNFVYYLVEKNSNIAVKCEKSKAKLSRYIHAGDKGIGYISSTHS